jgi:adenylyltransferase/sulfurtransferase
MQPDYSRQRLLKEIGAEGQAALARARVLIVGAGGLGSPVLQYLAGAGVGVLGLVEADSLEASNLHRQPLYALADVGKPKAALARAAILKINPDVRVETHACRLSVDNARALIGAHDVVVDCTDNFRAKFLINDAAVLAGRPAVFASVYQYEGQLQIYEPRASHACLRCLWPDALTDGIVGNCAEAGVLGPVPGALGALQALLTLKILLSIPGRLEGELMLLDFMSFTSTKLKAPRRAACAAPGCSLIRELSEGPAAGIEIVLHSVAEAAARGLELIDIRTAQEFAAHPGPGRHIPMHTLLADPPADTAGRDLLLVCASGKRSAAAARELRRRGIAAHSLRGGLPALEADHALQQ